MNLAFSVSMVVMRDSHQIKELAARSSLQSCGEELLSAMMS